MRSVGRAAWWLGAALWASPARAEEPAKYALSWVRGEGAESCPASRALVAEVQRRVGRELFEPSASRSFEVQVRRVGVTYHSDVYVRDASGAAVGQRSLASDEPGCGPIFDATALAIALVIDPEAVQRAHDAGGGSVAAFDSAPPSPAAAPSAPDPPAPPVAAPRPLATPALRPAEPPTPAPASSLNARMSLRGELNGGVVPGSVPGAGLQLSARAGGRWGFAAGASYVAPGAASSGSSEFEVGLTRGKLGIVLDAVSSERLRLVFGLGASLGAFHVVVREPTPLNPGDFLFLAAELGGRLELPLTRQVYAELGVEGLLPLRRQQFLAVGQAQAVWSQPWFSGLALLGVGMSIP